MTGINRIAFVYLNAFSQTGGIQTFNRQFIAALEQLQNEHDSVSAEIVTLHDNTGDVRSTLPLHSLGHSKPATFRFVLSRAKGYDTFIFAHINLAPVAAALYLVNPKAKILFCTHGIEVWKKLPRLTEWIMNRSEILTVSRFSMQTLEKYNANLNTIHLFPNCIKVKAPIPDLPNPFDLQAYNILSVTRLSTSERLKGIDTVIKALPKLKEIFPRVIYHVIGKGEDVVRLETLADELGVTEQVRFLGFVEEIDAYYQHCDVFTLPSKKEGFGIVYLEAMQYKKPVIACNYGGPTDVVDDTLTGFLCDYDDVEGICKAFSAIGMDGKLGNKLGENGYDKLMAHFTFEQFTRRLEAILIPGISSKSA